MNVDTLIENCVNELVNKGVMFTAYDVTKLARSRTDENVRHDNVRRIVNEVIVDYEDGGEYTRSWHTFVTTTGAFASATVWHRPEDNLSDYDSDNISMHNHDALDSVVDDDLDDIDVNTNAPVLDDDTDDTDNTDNTDNTDDDIYCLDSTGRLCVPKRFVSMLGLKSGDTVKVFKSGIKGLLVLSAFDLTGSDLIKTLKVDCYGNVKITQPIFKAVGYQGEGFVLRGDHNHVVIEEE